MSDDKRRHIELAQATGSWSSWVIDDWFTNRMMAIRVPEPFSEDRVLEYYCSCADSDDVVHRTSIVLPCSFIDWYGKRPSQTREVRAAWAAILPMLATATVLDQRLEGDRAVIDPLGVEVYRLPYPDGTWAGFQARFIDTANLIAAPDRWQLRRCPIKDREDADMLIGIRDGDVVAASMPVGAAVEGSRFKPFLVPAGSSGRDGLPLKVVAV